jgi:hypothetical protein
VEDLADLAVEGVYSKESYIIDAAGPDSYTFKELVRLVDEVDQNRLTEIARGLPFVFVTGYGTDSLPEKYRGLPALQKQFQSDHLKNMLAGMLAD